MSFVAQKLGFIKCTSQPKIEEEFAKRKCSLTTDLMEEASVKKGRKLSNEDELSDNSSLEFGRLRITESSQSDSQENKPMTIPVPVRAQLETKSVLTYQNFPKIGSTDNLKFPFSISQGIGSIPFRMEFPASEYLSSLIVPYGTPLKYVGPITSDERKDKVNRYLEKKKTRHWKNVKYTVRQELAQSRKRQHGRFVKSDKKWRWNQTPIATQVQPLPQVSLPNEIPEYSQQSAKNPI